MRVGGNVMAANLIQQVPAIYPEKAREYQLTGVVVLEAEINKDGKVESLKVITGHPLFVQPSLDAVKQWIYRPVLVNGQAVDVVTTITLNFSYKD
jgi:protein TonB